jgi:OmpA-OmpF porin, OOP family
MFCAQCKTAQTCFALAKLLTCFYLENVMNFMDLVKPYLTQTLMQKAASWLGESESGIAKALSAILPTLMGSVLSKSDNRGFMDGLSGLMSSPAMDHSSILSDVGSLFGANTASSPVGELGSKFLGSLLGDKQQAVSQALSQHAGIGVGSVGKLMGAAAPMLLAVLGKQSALSGGLSSLLGLLGGQKASLMSAIPGVLGSVLGFGNSAASAASSFSANNARTETKSGGFPLWLIPVLALGGLGAWWFTKGKPEEVKVSIPVAAPARETTPPVAQPIEPAAPVAQVEPAAISVFPDLGAFGERMLPGDVKLNIPANGIESRIVTFIEDATQMVDKETWFDFDRILFDTGAATLRPESNEQIGNIATILKAFPSVQLKIGGYTDNTGAVDANLKLSADRAAAVMNAIVALGIDGARLKSEGYGIEFPVADNATDEGRQKNRRVSARVTAK